MTSEHEADSWIASFVDWTAPSGSPKIWREWAAITTVSGLLERKVSLRTRKGPLYPNLFALLVGPPGIGKSMIIEKTDEVWKAVGDLRVAPSSITRAGFEDFMLEKPRQVTTLNGTLMFHSTLVASSEFGNFVKEYDNDWINVLNELYDCRSVYEYATRGGGRKKIDAPHITIIAGTQPQYLHHILPANAFGMGFTSRIIMVYSSEAAAQRLSVFGETKSDRAKEDAVIESAKVIKNKTGDFTITAEARDFIETNNAMEWAPVPKNPKLQHYNSRRLVHILKTAMCYCASRMGKLEINLADVGMAFKLLLETEAVMPQIFADMITSGVAELNMEFLNFAIQAYMRGGQKPVPEAILLQYMSMKLPIHQLRPTLDHMVEAGFLEPKETILPNGRKSLAYTPHAQSRHIKELREAEAQKKM